MKILNGTASNSCSASLRRRALLAAVLLASIAFAATASAAPARKQTDSAPSEVLRVHGSNTIGQALMVHLARQWFVGKGWKVRELARNGVGTDFIVQGEFAKHAGLSKFTLELRSLGTATGFVDLQQQNADIAMASRPINDRELSATARMADLREAGFEHVIAIDGLAIASHPTRTLRQLSIEQVRQIFSGNVVDWSQLGMAPGPITRYLRDQQSGTFDTFKSLVMEGAEPAAAQRFESNQALQRALVGNPNAIGALSAVAVKGLHVIAIGGGRGAGAAALAPDRLNLATEDYALSRRLYLYQKPALSPLGQELIRFTKSASGQNVAERLGFVSLELKKVAATLPAHASQDYKTLVAGSARLSLSFRFSDSSNDILDSRAVSDLERVARFMADPQHAKGEITLIGLSDNAANRALYAMVETENMVDLVSTALVRRGVRMVSGRGLGGAMRLPSTVPDTQSNRVGERNLRVEVWWKPKPSIITSAIMSTVKPSQYGAR